MGEWEWEFPECLSLTFRYMNFDTDWVEISLPLGIDRTTTRQCRLRWWSSLNN